MTRLRVGLLTDEFAGETPDAGGLGVYLHRLARALRDLGHEVEAFAVASGAPRVTERDGLRVERVARSDARWARAAARLGRRGPVALPPETLGRLRAAAGLARACARRHAAAPFDFVQSTNCALAGLLLPRRPGFRHVLRLSSLRDLWQRADRPPGARSRTERLDDALVARLERRCARRADVAYAPSRFLAEHASRAGLAVRVLRPPAGVEAKPSPPPGLPPRYLIHFGALRRRKGTDLLAEALPRVWAREPGFTMLWAGREREPGSLDRYRAGWGRYAARVHLTGPLDRAQLYGALERAVASVLPSRVDNLPNSAIESLLFGVPVIGSRGASLDELVEDGASGELVAVGDPAALADALLRAWRGEVAWLGAGFRRPAILDAMVPEVAARALIALALGERAP